jgi:phage shock protein C
MNTSQRLTRSNTDRIIAGVCGGIANYVNVDPTLVRLAFVLLVLAGGVSPLIYLVLWAVLPSEHSSAQALGQQVRENVSEMEQRTRQIAQQVGDQINQFRGEAKPTQSSSQDDPTRQP